MQTMLVQTDLVKQEEHRELRNIDTLFLLEVLFHLLTANEFSVSGETEASASLARTCTSGHRSNLHGNGLE